MIKKVLWLVMALVLVSQCFALGIAPGHVDVVFESGLAHKVDLKLMNSDGKALNVVLYAEGELADQIVFKETMVSFAAGEKEKLTSYTYKLPERMEKQGLHITKIVAREVSKGQADVGVSMAASVAVISKLNVMVPYAGKYAEIKLFSPHFEPGKSSNFAIEVKNLGTDKILSGQIVVDVFGPTNNKLSSASSEIFSLDPKKKDVIVVPWMPDLGSGSYKAVATLIYDGMNAKDEQPFSIGESMIEILGISVRDFKLGGIARFEIMLESLWNQDIPGVYGDVTAKDASGKVYTTSRTASVDIGSYEKQTIEAYWDTKSVGAGDYKLDIVLNYLGKKSEQVFDIAVSLNEIRTTAFGKVVSAEEGQNSSVMQGIYVLTFMVVLLIIFNVVIFFKKVKK
ncbi:MAG: hypothetical protein ABIG95_04515 [Candidatus Woesearchaeota archaeon]